MITTPENRLRFFQDRGSGFTRQGDHLIDVCFLFDIVCQRDAGKSRADRRRIVRIDVLRQQRQRIEFKLGSRRIKDKQPDCLPGNRSCSLSRRGKSRGTSPYRERPGRYR